MVRGCGIAVTADPLVSQWAEMHKIALGLGISFEITRQLRENSLSSIAFMGLPCPRNRTGIRVDGVIEGFYGTKPELFRQIW